MIDRSPIFPAEKFAQLDPSGKPLARFILGPRVNGSSRTESAFRACVTRFQAGLPDSALATGQRRPGLR